MTCPNLEISLRIILFESQIDININKNHQFLYDQQSPTKFSTLFVYFDNFLTIGFKKAPLTILSKALELLEPPLPLGRPLKSYTLKLG